MISSGVVRPNSAYSALWMTADQLGPISSMLPKDAFVSTPRGRAISDFGGVVYRKPSEAEVQLGMDPNIYILSTVTDYKPVLPQEPPSTEGLIAEDPYSESPGSGKGILDVIPDTLIGAKNKISEFWDKATPSQKNATKVAAMGLLSIPIFKGLAGGLKNNAGNLILANAIRGDRSGGAGPELGGPILAMPTAAQEYTKGVATMRTTPSGGADLGTELAVPVAFYESAMYLGNAFDTRSELSPWMSDVAAMSGDPAALVMLRSPSIALNSEGRICSPALYAAPLLAGGFFDSAIKIAKKVGKGVSKALGSPLVQTALDFIPGASSIAKVVKSVADKVSSVSAPATPDRVGELRPEVGSNYGPQPGSDVDGGRSPGDYSIVVDPYTPAMSPEIGAAGSVDQLPPAWRLTPDVEADKRIKAVLDAKILPLEGAGPLLVLAAPVLKQAAIWLAVSAAPYVIDGVANLWKKQSLSGPSLSLAAANAHVSGAPKAKVVAAKVANGFMKAILWFGRRLPKLPSILKGGMKSSGLLIAGAFIVSSWYEGFTDMGRFADLIAQALPKDDRSDWNSLARKMIKSQPSDMAAEEVQQLQGYVMQALALAAHRQSRGTASGADLELIRETETLYPYLQRADDVNLDRTAAILDAYIENRSDDVDDLVVNAMSEGTNVGGSGNAAFGLDGNTGADQAIPDASTNDGLSPEPNSTGTTLSADGSGLGAASPEEVAAADDIIKLQNDDALLAKMMMLLKAEVPEEELVSGLLNLGLASATVMAVVAIWKRAKDEGTLPRVATSQFWAESWGTLLSGVRRIRLFSTSPVH